MLNSDINVEDTKVVNLKRTNDAMTSRNSTNDETLQGKLEIEQRDKNGGKLGCFRRVGNSCSINDKRTATLVANPVISRERTQ
jgi:hypothetical protein